MVASNDFWRARVMALAATLPVTLGACDLLLGLDSYKNVQCAGLPDEVCEAGTVAHDGALGSDASMATDTDGGSDGMPVVSDGGYPAPSAHEVWVHWPMPNPNALIDPDQADSGSLPNPMAYDAGVDASAPVAYDVVTRLSWWRTSLGATSLQDSDGGAWEQCQALGAGWRVPTRIELVSLVDFTRANAGGTTAAVDPVAFPGTVPSSYWTSSTIPGDGGSGGSWIVSFATGVASYPGPAKYVLCVNGGAS